MRVIAGTAGGRRLVAPKGDRTRPTTDRVKESLFGSLHMQLPGARVLDLYAGSGALGIEAISRGAVHATFIEKHAAAATSIRENLATCGFAKHATVTVADVAATLAQPPREPFDIVVIDPPYARDDDELATVLERLVAWLADGALIRVEQDKRAEAPRWPDALSPGKVRRYGDTTIHEATRREHDA